jgi:hypothetical protein
MRDIYSNIKTVQALAPAVQAATINGASIDTKGSKSLAFVVNTGAIVGSGVFALSLEESDNASDWTAVAADATQGTLPTSMAAASVYRVGYLGYMRYARIVLTKTSGTSIAAGAVAVLEPLDKPAA